MVYRPGAKKATCCYSRVGRVKVSYPSKEAALVEVRKERDKYGIEMESYACQQWPGKFHVRKKRV